MKKILVVDDEIHLLRLLEYNLKKEGYRVVTACNGLEAIHKVEEEGPDLILLDIKMPVMDGLEAIKRIRSFYKELPIIVISAYVQDVKIKQSASYGISGIFYKSDDFEKGLG